MSTDLSFSVSGIRAFCGPPGGAARPGGLVPHSLILRVSLSCGNTGWGEAFGGMLSFGPAYRAKIVTEVLAPRLKGEHFSSPGEMSAFLTDSVHDLALEAREWGPFSQVIAALDIAVWDAVARRAGQPLWRVLARGRALGKPLAMAARSDLDTLLDAAPRLVADGWHAMRFDAGTSGDADRSVMAKLRGVGGETQRLSVRFGGRLTFEESEERLRAYRGERVLCVEEALPADRPSEEWKALATLGTPLGAGRDFVSESEFLAAADAGVAVLMPDPVKWGGLSGCERVAALAHDNARLWAPTTEHRGLGLAAAAHAAIAFGAAYVPADISASVSLAAERPVAVVRGHLEPQETIGLGVSPDPEALLRLAA